MKVHGIILAAGFSSRMGRTKALLDYQGETFVDRVRRTLRPYCDKVFVVGAPGAEFADVVNPDPARGMLSSLQCGLTALPADTEGVFFTLVDLPAIEVSTVKLLAEASRQARLVIPQFEGKNGHPVFVARGLFDEFLSADSTATPKTVIARHAPEILYVNCADPGIVRDADTPAEYRELIRNV